MVAFEMNGCHDDDWLISRFRFPKAISSWKSVLSWARSVSRGKSDRQLKSRWRCLDRSGGMLLYHPEKVCRIVQACGVLHNIAHRHGVPLHEVMALPDDPDPGPNNAQPNAEAIRSAAVNSKNIKKVNGDNIHF
ncbi:putative nuclease HARBI1 [Merluccius polli]|uniref:Nuclease HARBI1 n=1 Tax=Merluccius polli TaxID=89951 RepID=A0AA47NSE8_MERPO|nr:putative nuclease HARBI1 [Merluccius polli]